MRNKKYFMVALAVLGLSAQDLFAQASTPGTSVTVNVSGIKTSVGKVFVQICDKKNFMTSPCTYSQAAPAQLGSISLVFNNVAPGRYAATAFQDLDGTGELKFSLTGPAEPAGISGPKTLFPNFDKAAFDVGTEPMTISVALK
jgi:uncharacterized protein (DUF2141 family)